MVARTQISYAPCFIQRLSSDILVDCVFIYLYIEDILSLRRVNKQFYIITHTPSIWKRLLIKMQRLRYLIPPLPPLPYNTFPNADLDVEQLVIRSITMDENWKSTSPQLFHKNRFDTGSTIVDMKLAPGGKYLVVSTKDAASYHCYLTVHAVDHPSGPMPLARVDTITKAYNLEVRYVKLKGTWGLWIAYVRRELKPAPSEDRFGYQRPIYDYYCNIDPADIFHETEVEPPPGYEFNYEIQCYHVPLDALEMLSDPRLAVGCPEFITKLQTAPDPFIELGGFVTLGPISNITLFQYQSKSGFVCIHNQDRVLYASTGHGCYSMRDLSLMILAPDPEFDHNEHIVEAVHPLPNQGSLLIARKIRQGRAFNIAVLEIYDIPSAIGEQVCEAKYRIHIVDRDVISIQISESESPITVPEELVSSGPPHPISIFIRMKQPGVAHYLLYASPVELPSNKLGLGPRRYRFILDKLVPQSVHISRPYECNVLPGVHKSLIYNVEMSYPHPSVVNIRRHHSASKTVNEEHDIYHPKLPEDEQVTRRGILKAPGKVFATLDTPGFIDEINLHGGLSAITWDESIGRVCFATWGDSYIRLLDYGQCTHPDSRLRKWEKEVAELQRRLERYEEMFCY